MPIDVDALAEFLAPRRRLFVLTGAGCSTESGIPDYRDADGAWKHRQPMRYQEFVASAAARRRYWARSLVGWRRIAAAEPNPAHRALMVFSGFRFARAAAERGVPIALLNLGRTRADDLATLKVEASCAEVLPRAVERLLGREKTGRPRKRPPRW